MARGDGVPAAFEVSVDELVAADVVRAAGKLDFEIAGVDSHHDFAFTATTVA